MVADLPYAFALIGGLMAWRMWHELPATTRVYIATVERKEFALASAKGDSAPRRAQPADSSSGVNRTGGSYSRPFVICLRPALVSYPRLSAGLTAARSSAR
jgi:hypothetical protein